MGYLVHHEQALGRGEPIDAANISHSSFRKSRFAQANGTGPFRVETHLPGIRTTFKVNREWWDRSEHNLTEIIFMPIASDATRVAALLTGEVDLIEPVPVQDIGRVNASSNARVLIGPELRTIFLGFDQLRDELLESDVAGRNPFKDRRVRQAIYQAIDIESIRDRTMRGLARPSALMIAPELFPKAKDFPRLPFDPAAARGLLVEAGYQGGFEVGMDCPNDRYVNDEAICQAVAGMLAKIGVRVRLNAQPKARFFAKVLKSNGYRTSLYLLGWTPSTTDAQHTLEDLYGCRTDPKSARGHVNLGGYCNRELEILIDRLALEIDPGRRGEIIKRAFEITTHDFAYVPLHQQMLAWGVSKRVTVVQRPDNSVLLYWATKEPSRAQ